MSNSGTTAAKWYALLLFLTFLGLVLGMVWIFQMTFRPGSVYPAYSSLRADPLGSKLLHHSLGQLPGARVSRSYLPLTQVDLGSSEGVFFFLGVKEKDLRNISVAEAGALEKALDQGWRIVITLQPEKDSAGEGSKGSEKKGPEKAEAPPLAADPRESKELEDKAGSEESGPDYYPGRRVRKARHEKQLVSSYFKTVSLLNRWDIQLKTLPFPSAEEEDPGESHPDEITEHLVRALPAEGSGLGGSLPLFGETVVKFHSKEWRPLFGRDKDPVAMERKFGRGSVVFVTDTYAFSNQSLAQEPALDLLEWCLDSNKKFIFDESHHGLAASPGVMSLARTLRLEGLFTGLLLLALLLIWRASRSFPPLRSGEEKGEFPEGAASPRDQLDGLANLLQRGLPLKELMGTCLKEWKQSHRPGPEEEGAVLVEAESLSPETKPALILETFNRLHQHHHQKIRL